MPSKPCGQVNVPKTDNDNIACETIVSSSCVLLDRVSPKMNNIIGESLTSYFEKLDNKLSSLENVILILQQDLDALAQRVTDLE